MIDDIDTIDVKALRDRLGWSQERMAAELGLDRSTVSRMEAGQPQSGPTKILLRRMVQDVDSGALKPDAESSARPAHPATGG